MRLTKADHEKINKLADKYYDCRDREGRTHEEAVSEVFELSSEISASMHLVRITLSTIAVV